MQKSTLPILVPGYEDWTIEDLATSHKVAKDPAEATCVKSYTLTTLIGFYSGLVRELEKLREAEE
jgi:hypothetical protein